MRRRQILLDQLIECAFAIMQGFGNVHVHLVGAISSIELGHALEKSRDAGDSDVERFHGYSTCSVNRSNRAFPCLSSVLPYSGFPLDKSGHRCAHRVPKFEQISNFWTLARPAKAGMFSGSQSHQGKSQSPVTWVASVEETKRMKPTDKAIFRMVSESPGRNASEPSGGLDKKITPEAEPSDPGR